MTCTLLKTTVLAIVGFVFFSVYGAEITVRDDMTLLKDGEPWFPILHCYNVVENGFNCHSQYYDSADAAGFNGVFLHGDWVCRGGMQNCVTSDIGFQSMCGPGSSIPFYDARCNHARDLVPLLVPYLNPRGWVFTDGGWPLFPYNWYGANEEPVVLPLCMTDDPVASRRWSTDICVELVGASASFMGFYFDELNNWPRDFGDLRWGEDDFYDLQSALFDQRAYIQAIRPGSVIFLNFSPSTAARVDITGEGLEGTGEQVGVTGPRARELWAQECNILAEAADIVGLDWQWDSPRDVRYNIAYNVLDNAGGVIDTSVRTMGEYAHYLVDLIGQPQNKPTIFTANWPYVGYDETRTHEVGGPVTDAELISAWVQCLVAGVKGFAVYSWWAWGEFTPGIEEICPIEVNRHRMMRRVMGNVFKPLNEWGVLTARDAATQPVVTAPDHLLEQLTKQVGPDQWMFAVDRSAEGSIWPYNATFSGYGAATGPIEVFHDGEDYSQRWLWPTSGSFTDQFERLQSHIYRIYGGGLHDTVDIKTDLNVPSRNSLVINPGTVIRVSPGAKLRIEGRIVAQGTAQNPIVFTCSDTTQRWHGISIRSDDEDNVLDYVEISHAYIGVNVRDGYLMMRHSTLRDCERYGAAYAFSSGVVDECTVTDCGQFGVFLAASEVNLSDCEIANNPQGGVRVVRGDYRIGGNSIFANGIPHDSTRVPWCGVELSGAHAALRCNNIHENEGPGVFLFAGGYAAMNEAWNHVYDNMQGVADLGYDYGQIHFQGGLASLGRGWNSISSTNSIPPTGRLVWNSLMDSVSFNMTGNYWGTTDSASIAARLPEFTAFIPMLGQALPCLTIPIDSGEVDHAEAIFNQGWDQEHQGLFEPALDSYDSLVTYYPKSEFAKAALDRIEFCKKAMNWAWSDIRSYFLDLAADSAKDSSLVNQCKTTAAWCLANMDEFAGARDELAALVDSSTKEQDVIRNQLTLLMVDLKDTYYEDSLFCLPGDPSHGGRDSDGLDSQPHIALDQETARLIVFSNRLDDLLWRSSGRSVDEVPKSPSPVSVPTEHCLYQNYPNPFNPTTEIRFDLPEDTQVKLQVFNTLGQLVTTLVDEVRPAGSYRVAWDSKGASGIPLAAGVYVYQIKAGNFTDAKKMVLIR